MRTRPALISFGFLLATSGTALAQNASTVGAASAPYPTVENASLEWLVTGDVNANGTVGVKYRVAGQSAWLDGLPLRRVPGASNEGFTWANRHAGSLFGLTPATSYEVELTLTDPDGGDATESLTFSTRAIPAPAANGTVIPVTPATFAEAAVDALPGDILELADGEYDGFEFMTDGTLESPIVIRAVNPGMAVVNGDVRLDGRSYIYVEGLTVNGKFKFNDAEGIAVTKCVVNTPDDGIVSLAGGVTNAYICDNVVNGPTTGYDDSIVGADGNNSGEGIQLTGPGNVICNNKVSGFRDCVSTLEDAEAENQVSIDILRNDLDHCADDAVEADFAMGNVRVMQNRILQSYVGLSSQPSLGGPTYFIRNVMYDIIYSPFKLHRGSVGDVAFHNTAVKCGDAFAVYADVPWSRAFFRNNLFIGGTGGGTYGGYGNGDGDVLSLAAADATCSFDYDGLGSDGTNKFTGRIGSVTFSSLAELKAGTSEKNAVELGLDTFAATIPFPEDPYAAVTQVDLQLGAGSAAVDKGVPLANVNDGFSGSAPDLGAYEIGTAPPEYGPRSGGPGGSSGTGGSGTGGSGTGGSSASGNGGNGAGGSGAGSGANSASGDSDDEGGCGCRTAPSSSNLGWLAVLGLALLARRRR
jgi:MYXO-CTERM domain-containing protein